MPTYIYFCPSCDKEFEEYHSITEQIEECPLCIKEGRAPAKVKRLIASQNGFILNGGGWARDRYSK